MSAKIKPSEAMSIGAVETSSTLSTSGRPSDKEEPSPQAIFEEVVADVTGVKELGNAAFKNSSFVEAIRHYTNAIELAELHDGLLSDPVEAAELSEKLIPMLYCNRSLTYIKLEAFGAAVLDATKAIELSKNRSPKAFFRRGNAYTCLIKYDKAVKDFKIANRLAPSDPAGAQRLKEAQRLLSQQRFSEAIKSEAAKPPSQLLDLNDYIIEPTYKGPVYESDADRKPELFSDFINYLQVHTNRLPKRVLVRLALDAINDFAKQPNVLDIDLPNDAATTITVCGDIHGQFHDLIAIFNEHGYPSEQNRYLFNGDFVDRGSFSVEVIATLYVARLIWPNGFYMTRGNHESRRMTKLYGFEGEMRNKASSSIYDLYCESFDYLPLAHRINKKIFVVHGGLSTKPGVTLKDINAIDRICDEDDDLMSDLLWADPQKENGSAPSKRGVSNTFGPDVTDDFLKTNDMQLVIRSHEMKEAGYEIEHSGKLITVFSAPNYCDQMGNQGAVIKFDGKSLNSDKPVDPKIVVFSAVPHPPVRAMAYANPLFMN